MQLSDLQKSLEESGIKTVVPVTKIPLVLKHGDGQVQYAQGLKVVGVLSPRMVEMIKADRGFCNGDHVHRAKWCRRVDANVQSAHIVWVDRTEVTAIGEADAPSGIRGNFGWAKLPGSRPGEGFRRYARCTCLQCLVGCWEDCPNKQQVPSCSMIPLPSALSVPVAYTSLFTPCRLLCCQVVSQTVMGGDDGGTGWMEFFQAHVSAGTVASRSLALRRRTRQLELTSQVRRQWRRCVLFSPTTVLAWPALWDHRRWEG